MRNRTTFTLLLALLCATGIASAQTFPSRPIRIVVPFPAGAGGDFVTRLYTPRMGEALGQPFIVENRSGASGNIGAESIARAAPDGHSLLTVSSSHAVAQNVYKNLPYELIRDFEPVALLAYTPQVLVVHPSIPVKSVGELVALAKAQPGKLTFASSGLGSASHLSAEMLKMQAQIELLHVPYKGTAQALTDLTSGQLSMMFASQVSSFIKAGRLRAIAISSAQRSRTAPDLPTVAESGLPGYESGVWFGLIAPKGTPMDTVNRLNATAVRIGQSQEVRDLLMSQSAAEPLSGTPAQVGNYLKSEIAKWRQLVLALGLREE